VYPVSLRRGAGAVNTSLQIYLYRNQLQLTTPDAFYSDGHRYRPAVDAVNHLKSFLPTVKDVLVLGTGLGSMVQVLRHKGFSPRFTLVEYDKTVLEWAIEFLAPLRANLEPVCMDAQLYMGRNTHKYDLIFVDVFNGRVVPAFVTSAQFLAQCRNSLAPGGRLILNYIINDPRQWDEVVAAFAILFPIHQVLEIQVNRILISG